ncbi:MAG: lytic transglycosylase domain-containing protein [Chitinophagaceae bacterium]|nr:lytic transglycosylase domain-containing protein [Chitinophagaceae bacterium]
MSKSKLSNAGLVTNGLLLITAVVSIAATQKTAFFSKRVVSDTGLQQVQFDTAMLTLTGLHQLDATDVPAITMNKQAKAFVTNYISRNGDDLERIKENKAATLAIIDEVFTKYGLPLELKYLAVVESELNTKALSRVGARGAWQLMPETARLLSLKVTKRNDERTHLYKSTVAAAKYLRDLYRIFGDWTLVIAGYNSGPGRVLSAIKRSGSRNFWKLQYHLPAETRGHVKRFIGTHYFFEGKGSVTTLTKQEVVAYRKTMQAFVAKQNAILRERQEAAIDSAASNTEVIAQTITPVTIKGVNEK